MNQLFYAVVRNYIFLARKLFAHGLVVDDTELDAGMALIQLAACFGFTAFAKLLIEKGADVNATSSSSGRTSAVIRC